MCSGIKRSMTVNAFAVALMLLISMPSNAASKPADVNSEGEAICYLPTESNVTYQNVLSLQTESPDHVISYGDDQFQFAELWLPKNGLPKNGLPKNGARAESDEVTTKRHPLVVLIHGGCWLNAFDIKHTHALSTALSRAGYAVWSVEYRRTGDVGGGWPGTYNDIKAAIAYLPKLSDYAVDLNQVAITGHSAGGHLALLAGSENLYDFRAVIGLAAIVDIEQYARGSNSCEVATPKFIGGSLEELASTYRDANPRYKDLPSSSVLIHGSADKIVSPEQATHTNARTNRVDGASHFDMIHPGTLSYQALLRELVKAFK